MPKRSRNSHIPSMTDEELDEREKELEHSMVRRNDALNSLRGSLGEQFTPLGDHAKFTEVRSSKQLRDREKYLLSEVRDEKRRRKENKEKEEAAKAAVAAAAGSASSMQAAIAAHLSQQASAQTQAASSSAAPAPVQDAAQVAAVSSVHPLLASMYANRGGSEQSLSTGISPVAPLGISQIPAAPAAATPPLLVAPLIQATPGAWLTQAQPIIPAEDPEKPVLGAGAALPAAFRRTGPRPHAVTVPQANRSAAVAQVNGAPFADIQLQSLLAPSALPAVGISGAAAVAQASGACPTDGKLQTLLAPSVALGSMPASFL